MNRLHRSVESFNGWFCDVTHFKEQRDSDQLNPLGVDSLDVPLDTSSLGLRGKKEEATPLAGPDLRAQRL